MPQESAVPAQDPFTGSGRYIPPSEIKPVNTFFPVKDFLRFDQANIEAIKSNFHSRQYLNLCDSVLSFLSRQA